MNEFDGKSFMKALLLTSKSRWWVIPVCMAVASGLLFAQASGLDRKPSKITVERSFQARDSKPLLSALEIDPTSISPVPNLAGVVAAIESPAFSDELKRATGVGATFTVKVTENALILGCRSNALNDCDVAYSYTTEQLELLRNEAVQANLTEVADVLEVKLESVMRLIPLKSDPSQLADLRLRELDLITKIESLRELAKSKFFRLYPSGERVIEQSTTIYSVNAQTYALGLLAGGILGVLLFMQIVWNRMRRSQRTG